MAQQDWFTQQRQPDDWFSQQIKGDPYAGKDAPGPRRRWDDVQGRPPEGGDLLVDNLRNIGGFLRSAVKTASEHPITTGAILGAGLAAPFTGGGSLAIPAALVPPLAAAGGGAGGAGLGMIYGAARGDSKDAIPATPGGIVKGMAKQGAIQGVTEGGAGLLSAGLTRGATRLMQSALKPTDTLVKARAGAGYGSKDAIARAVLDEGRIVTQGSLRKAQAALDATDAAARQALSSGAGRGVMVDALPVAQAIEDVAGPSGGFGRQINAGPDIRAIRDVATDFLSNPDMPQSGQLAADVAHEFASNTGRNLKGKFGRLGNATVEAEKAGREAIVSQLRTKIPELAPLWRDEARQITTREALDKALQREGNRDIVSLPGWIGALNNPGMAVAGMANSSGALKSMLANALWRTPAPSGNALRAALLARLQADQSE